MSYETPLSTALDLRAKLAAAGMVLPPLPMEVYQPVVTQGAMPASAAHQPVVTQGLNEAQVIALIDKAMIERMAISPVNKAFESVFAKALTPTDFQAFQQYVANGSLGFAAMLEGGKFDPLAQLLWEIIKENTK